MMDEPEKTGPDIEPDVPESRGEIGGKPVYTVAAVDRALDLLDILARTSPVSLARIAGEAGCTRTAAFRLLRTMAARGYVTQDGPRGHWRLGDRMSAKEKPETASQNNLIDLAAPVLERVARETGRVVYLLQRKGLEATVIALRQTDPVQRRYAEIGDSLPLHAGCGRLLLALAPAPVQTLVLAGRLARFSPATITNPRRLAAEIRIIRERGWFTSQDELVPGSIAFSAPIRDRADTASWMLTISCPTIVVAAAERRSLLRAVIAAADKISAQLRAADSE